MFIPDSLNIIILQWLVEPVNTQGGALTAPLVLNIDSFIFTEIKEQKNRKNVTLCHLK